MADIKGTFIVTGANGGLGRALVSRFLNSPESSTHKGQFAVRSPSSATGLQKTISAAPHAEDHDIITIDLGTLASVRSAAQTINKRVSSGEIPPIRALVLNAAVQFTKSQTFTNDGLESHFAINYLANFLLVLLLLRSMDKEMGRVVIVSSWTHDTSHPLNWHIVDESHKIVMRDPQDLAKPREKDKEGDEYNSGMRRYGMSKTLIVMFMFELQRRLSGTEYSDISILAVDPGAMPDTDLLRDSSLALRITIGWIMGPITPLLTYLMPNGYFRTRQKSAKDLYNATFDEQYLGKHPKAIYLDGSAIAQASAEARDEGKQKQLWEASVKLAELQGGETVLPLRN